MAARVERKESGRGRRGRGVRRAATGSGDGVAAPGRWRQGDRGGQIQNGEEEVVAGELRAGARLATAERRGRQRALGAAVAAPIQKGIGESRGECMG